MLEKRPLFPKCPGSDIYSCNIFNTTIRRLNKAKMKTGWPTSLVISMNLSRSSVLIIWSANIWNVRIKLEVVVWPRGKTATTEPNLERRRYVSTLDVFGAAFDRHEQGKVCVMLIVEICERFEARLSCISLSPSNVLFVTQSRRKYLSTCRAGRQGCLNSWSESRLSPLRGPSLPITKRKN